MRIITAGIICAALMPTRIVGSFTGEELDPERRLRSANPRPGAGQRPAEPVDDETGTPLGQELVKDALNEDTVAKPLEEGAGVNIDDSDGETALMIAASGNRSETLEMMITAGADVNTQGSDGITPLQRALELGNKNTIRFLMTELGVDTQGSDFNNALTYAIEHGDLETLKKLIPGGAVDK